MTHLNELDEKFADKGLSIVGVTSEGTGPTEKWVEEKGAKYAYAYDKSSALSKFCGVTGIPNAVLVDPSGRIVWQGGPGGLTDDVIEKALVGALKTPMYEWPSDASAVRSALAKSQMKKALDAAAKLEDTTYADAINGIVSGRVAGLKAAHDAGDYLTAVELADSLKKSLSGLDAADEVAEISKAISSNAEAKKIMKGQAKVRKLRDEKINTKKDVEELLKAAEKLATQFAGTAAGSEADAFAAELRARLG